MPPTPKKRDQTPPSSWLLRRRDQLTVVVALLLFLAGMAIYWVHQGGLRGGLIDIDDAPPLEANFTIDPNQAQWYEWVQIPGIGETLGRRIVEERNQNGPYLDHEEIQRRVSGIGPKTLNKMRPYLRPMPRGGNMVGG